MRPYGGSVMICSFIGHGDIWETKEIEIKLKEILEKIIEEKGVATFYLGGYGQFDFLCATAVREIKVKYPHIKSYLILAYYNPKIDHDNQSLYDGTIYPNLEHIPKRFCILERNKWIVDNSNIIISQVKYSFGGAYKTFEYARKPSGKIIVRLDKI